MKKKARAEAPVNGLPDEGPLQAPTPRQEEVAEARALLHDAAPRAAETLINIMQAGDKEDLVRKQAAVDILAINGIAAKKEQASSQAKVVGAAVIAAIAGMAKVAGLQVSEKTFAKALRNATPADDLPPELAEQDALT